MFTRLFGAFVVSAFLALTGQPWAAGPAAPADCCAGKQVCCARPVACCTAAAREGCCPWCDGCCPWCDQGCCAPQACPEDAGACCADAHNMSTASAG